jgi:TetR/AcrR family transcriptional repressor of mexJK operon
LVARWIATDTPHPAEIDDVEATLLMLAEVVMAVALTPEALALHRLMIAESARFPELGAMLHATATEAGLGRIARLLAAFVAAGRLPPLDPRYAAEQFLHLVLRGPQARALGLAPSLGTDELRDWGRRAVRLFLHGIAGPGAASSA